MKKTLTIVFAIIVIAIIGFISYQFTSREKNNVIQPTGAQSPKDTTYLINDESITLKNGISTIAIASSSASKETTQYFGNEATGDLNGDGKVDTAFLLTQDNGGSGTFFYVTVALLTDKGYQGTNAILLGDRIAPQATEIKDGEIIVNYADRKLDEPFSVQPSVGVSKYFKVVNGILVEVK